MPPFYVPYYQFDGLDDYVEVANDSALSFGDGVSDRPFTFIFYGKIDSLNNQWRYVGGKGAGAGDREYYFGFASDDTSLIGFCFTLDGETRIGRRSGPMSLEQIQEVAQYAFVYDGSGNESGISLYRNEIRIDQHPSSIGSYTAMTPTTNALEIMALTGLGRFAEGVVFHYSVLDRDLSQSEIAALSVDGLWVLPSTMYPDDVVAESQNDRPDVWPDTSGNNRDGVVYGDPAVLPPPIDATGSALLATVTAMAPVAVVSAGSTASAALPETVSTVPGSVSGGAANVAAPLVEDVVLAPMAVASAGASVAADLVTVTIEAIGATGSVNVEGRAALSTVTVEGPVPEGSGAAVVAAGLVDVVATAPLAEAGTYIDAAAPLATVTICAAKAVVMTEANVAADLVTVDVEALGATGRGDAVVAAALVDVAGTAPSVQATGTALGRAALGEATSHAPHVWGSGGSSVAAPLIEVGSLAPVMAASGSAVAVALLPEATISPVEPLVPENAEAVASLPMLVAHAATAKAMTTRGRAPLPDDVDSLGFMREHLVPTVSRRDGET